MQVTRHLNMTTSIEDEDKIIERIKIDSDYFSRLSICNQVNARIAKAAVVSDGSNIRYLAQKQQGDIEFAIPAVKSNPKAWFHLSMLLQKDEQIVLLVLEQSCTIELLNELKLKFSLNNPKILELIINKIRDKK